MAVLAFTTDLSFLHLSGLTLLGAATLVAFYLGRVARLVKLPSLIGYMVIGVVLGPSVLHLLDEPLMGLSPLIQVVLVKATREIRDEKGISMIVTEQYARPVLPIVDYAFILENGAAVLEGTRTELMENPDIRSAYFGV